MSDIVRSLVSIACDISDLSFCGRATAQMVWSEPSFRTVVTDMVPPIYPYRCTKSRRETVLGVKRKVSASSSP